MKTITLPLHIMLLLIIATQLSAQTVQVYENKSDSFYTVEKYDSAIKYAYLVEPLIIDTFGKKSLVYASFVGQYYSLIYEKMNNIDSAVYWGKYSIQLFEQLNDTTSVTYGETLGNYGNLLNTNVSITEAFPYLQKAFKVLGKHPENADSYGASIDNLANYYNYCGEYSTAEALFRQCVQLMDQNPALKPRESVVLHNLAIIYLKTGYFSKSEEYFIKAQNSSKNVSGGMFTYFLSGIGLGGVYMSTNALKKAEILYNKLINDSIWQNKAYNNPQNIYAVLYPELLNSLGNVKEQQKKYVEAENLFLKSVSISNQLNLPTLYKFNKMYSLAHLYAHTKRYLMADSVFEYLSINFNKNITTDRFFYVRMSVDYCENLLKLNQIEKAMDKTKFITQMLLENFHNNFPGMTEDEQMKYLHSVENYINLAFSVFTNINTRNKSSIKLALNQLLQFKGMILNYQTRRLLSLHQSSDTALAALNKHWISLKEILYKKYSGNSNLTFNTDSINKLAEDIDEKIALKTGTPTDNINNKLVDEISNKLKTKEAALEYIHYKEIKTNINVYGVFIMRFGKEPEYIQLCTEKQLKDCLKENNSFTVQSQIINDQAIYNLIWKPVQSLLNNIDMIYYSPDGLLNYLSFDGIKTGINSYLLNDKKMVRLTSTRILLNTTLNENKLDAAVLWGQIDCSEKAYLTNTYTVKNKKSERVNSGLPDDFKGAKQNYFPAWDDKELPAIIEIAKQKNVPINVFAKKDATEENFKQNATSFKSVLHISSHGFYANRPTDTVVNASSLNQFNSQINPLLRCGLILNGGNYVWGGKKPLPNKEDGILTGYEIALMDLSKVDLVVLSACETGLGDIDPGSEGVLGLQRAFKLAGVKKMVLTLWEVGVKDTKNFMTYFYQELFNGKNPETALYDTKKAMAKSNSPLAWAAFELVE